MDSFKILFKRSAEKELRRISPPYLSQILKKIHSLAAEPRPEGIQMLKGENRHFRLRQGDYRIIYEVDTVRGEVVIIKIGHRREVYE
ncbi:MAG TPA: type II toxin-antitoxin system RelE/ParE family toxin [bacterium]|nr:type II toxin-antitoxin system RelE/ParE family toxin [bacterium]